MKFFRSAQLLPMEQLWRMQGGREIGKSGGMLDTIEHVRSTAPKASSWLSVSDKREQVHRLGRLLDMEMN
ncbi:hypothetical protein [Bradyrhizobium sp. SZCCHNPS1003]|uniref:hypothetical protein n=1 Tax=Bradyrhizobium sp. SZCCHNPS1003 TaxID=3057330 RepID=UPI0028E55102|nr:hypothetical protein [Bradyrhizobium sp. SZCCHNPS1003]